MIAYLQWRTNQNKLKLDLFEKRYAVYRATTEFIGTIYREGTAKDESLQRFALAIGPAQFLFEADVDAQINEIYKRALDMSVNRAYRSDLPAGTELKQLAHEHDEHLGWFLEQGPMIAKKFAPYLKLTH